MVKEGYYFGVPPLVAGAAAIAGQWYVSGAVLLALGLFVFSFFRDPHRSVPPDPSLVVAPADGRVVVVVPEARNGRPGTRISIFLAIWNVHVNRSPVQGTISSLTYRPGKFMAAWAERASLDNEQNVFVMETAAGPMEFKQIAGLVARRVVSWKKQGEALARGERIGLMRFGSRMDVWLPEEAKVLIKAGDTVAGGSSALASWTAAATTESSPVAQLAEKTQ
jgi:phosphatidylserine decarboxylase